MSKKRTQTDLDVTELTGLSVPNRGFYRTGSRLQGRPAPTRYAFNGELSAQEKHLMKQYSHLGPPDLGYSWAAKPEKKRTLHAIVADVKSASALQETVQRGESIVSGASDDNPPESGRVRSISEEPKSRSRRIRGKGQY